jgi:hypothetical protein
MPISSKKQLAEVLRRIRLVLGLFIFGLILSGVTAFPLQRELEIIATSLGIDQMSLTEVQGVNFWILTIRDGLRETYAKYPWVAYGTDWLAFAHIVIAVFFLGPLIDPVRNIWVLRAGLIACLLVLPLALIVGGGRQIPLGWRLLDCSFGIMGAVPLWYCLKLTKRIEALAKI